MPTEFDQSICLVQVTESDFDQLAELRIDAMRDSLERVGRFSPDRARERLRKSFYPEHSRAVVIKGEVVGFYTFRPVERGFQLDHLYIHPKLQSKGVGSFILKKLFAEADMRHHAIHLGALKESRSNRFYIAHGFEKKSEDEWDIYYTRECTKPSEK